MKEVRRAPAVHQLAAAVPWQLIGQDFGMLEIVTRKGQHDLGIGADGVVSCDGAIIPQQTRDALKIGGGGANFIL